MKKKIMKTVENSCAASYFLWTFFQDTESSKDNRLF